MRKNIDNSNSLYVKIEDYKFFDYEIPEIFLDFVIEKKQVTLKTKLNLIKKNKTIQILRLDGKGILIEKIYLIFF